MPEVHYLMAFFLPLANVLAYSIAWKLHLQQLTSPSATANSQLPV